MEFKMRYLSIVLIISIIIIGCRNAETSFNNDYQIVTSTDGCVYRLNKRTGDMMIITHGVMHKVSQSEQTLLVVHELYKTEEGKVIQYEGKGNFVPYINKIVLDRDAIDAELAKRNRSEGAVPKRLPGETIPEYMKRIDPLGIR